MRSVLRFAAVLCMAIAVMLLFRAVAFTIYTVPQPGISPWLKGGDRVVVNRWSYGLRTGGTPLFSYARWIGRPVGKGQLLAFNHPLDTARAINRRPVGAAFCAAQPGDTVMLKGMPVVVPRKWRAVKVEPWNAPLLAATYRIHEHRQAHADTLGNLYVEGKPVRLAYFSKNYYWVRSLGHDRYPDSRTFGFVPEDHIIGRIVMVAYSKGNSTSWLNSFRKDRFFMPL